MKIHLASLLACFAISFTAIAQDTELPATPMDQGTAACMDRDINAATGACILRGNGGRTDAPPVPLTKAPGYNDDNRATGRPATTPAEGPSAAAATPVEGPGAIKTDR